KELQVVEIVVGGGGQREVRVVVLVRVALDADVLAAQAEVERSPLGQLVDGFEEVGRIELPRRDDGKAGAAVAAKLLAQEARFERVHPFQFDRAVEPCQQQDR